MLDTWRESCVRGEEKYCIAIFAIHSKSDYVSYFIFDSLGAVVRNCDNGMAGSCHAVGEYCYNIYTESPNGKEALSMSESALLYLQKACDLGMAVSCSFVAQMYKYGHFQDATEQAKIHEDKARGIASRDCKAGVKIACDFKEILALEKNVLVLLLRWL